MEIKCVRENLLDGIQTVQKAVSTRTTLPILTSILFQTDEDKVTLSATNLEIAIECKVDANILSKGAVVVPARLIGDIIRNLPEAAIEITSSPSNNQLKILCGQAEFNIKTLPPEDFPRFPEIPTKSSYTVAGDLLIETVKQVTRAASHDETRPVLTGVLINITKDRLKMVATDSYRLAVREIGVKKGVEEKARVVIPARTLEEVIKIIPPKRKEIDITLTENQIIFNLGEVVLISRLIEGQFPNYQQLLPEDHKMRLEVDREKFAGAVKRVSLLALNNSPLKLSIKGSKMKISAQTAEVGLATEEIGVNKKGEDMDIALNAQFLMDGVTSVEGDAVVFEVLDPLKPGLIRSVAGGDFLYLIMPVRIG
ncbi:MAG: DNA polymerase III subunit beta [Actinomycetota bacterium]|nr:DNA polymerase III subunit beta [Actinomycetota bacterium]